MKKTELLDHYQQRIKELLALADNWEKKSQEVADNKQLQGIYRGMATRCYEEVEAYRRRIERLRGRKKQ